MTGQVLIESILCRSWERENAVGWVGFLLYAGKAIEPLRRHFRASLCPCEQYIHRQLLPGNRLSRRAPATVRVDISQLLEHIIDVFRILS